MVCSAHSSSTGTGPHQANLNACSAYIDLWWAANQYLLFPRQVWRRLCLCQSPNYGESKGIVSLGNSIAICRQRQEQTVRWTSSVSPVQLVWDCIRSSFTPIGAKRLATPGTVNNRKQKTLAQLNHVEPISSTRSRLPLFINSTRWEPRQNLRRRCPMNWRRLKQIADFRELPQQFKRGGLGRNLAWYRKWVLYDKH